MKKIWILFILFFGSFPVFAQYNEYIIEFKDKAGSPYSISQPDEYLSQRAIERRNRQGIAINENDLPVNPAYIDSIRKSGHVIIRNSSKWLNQVYIETTDEAALQKIFTFQFVKGSRPVKRVAYAEPATSKKFDFEKPLEAGPGARPTRIWSVLPYGVSEGQIKIHKGDYLHDKGFTGTGMLVSVIDAGYYHYLTLPAFDSVRMNHNILDTFDFVGNKHGLNEEHSHGMQCFGLIAANIPGEMVGTAPAASFLLYRSENANAEYPGEEQNWIAACERSDSAGADVITTSLGYNTFDNSAFDYTYQDMNGRTTMMARAASIAASKGMILMVAAGNDGNYPWHYIGTPGDAMNVLTVGAVDINGNPGAFSSYGPSSDGRIKPDVSSVGVAAYVPATSGGFLPGNGTSYATPNLAGLVTCLWQAFPDFNSFEIMDVVRKSADQYTTPDDRVGYGIPDFERAYKTLERLREQRKAAEILKDNRIVIFPNPMQRSAALIFKPPVSGAAVLRWYDAAGKLCFSQTENFNENELKTISLKRNGLAGGVYFIRFEIGGEKFFSRIVLQ